MENDFIQNPSEQSNLFICQKCNSSKDFIGEEFTFLDAETSLPQEPNTGVTKVELAYSIKCVDCGYISSYISKEHYMNSPYSNINFSNISPYSQPHPKNILKTSEDIQKWRDGKWDFDC